MFNLDQKISEWRRQMLAAGIKTPAPLEELEIHLREEIEPHIKSGLNEAEAFQAAVEKIGQAHLLQKEFKKVEKDHKIIRAITFLGWLAASCISLDCILGLVLNGRFGGIPLKWNPGLIADILGVLLAATAIWFLAKDHKIIRAIMLGIGWLAAGNILLYGVVGWDFDWNFFNFSPKWNRGFIYDMLGILVSLAAIWFLAKASRDKTSRAVSLLVCVLLAAGAVSGLPSEKIPTAEREQALVSKIGPQSTTGQVIGGIVEIQIVRAFSRSEPSPLWFRGGVALLLCVPSVFWVWWTWRDLARKRRVTHGDQLILSN